MDTLVLPYAISDHAIATIPLLEALGVDESPLA